MNKQKKLKQAKAKIARLQERIIMAADRLDIAFEDDPLCIHCVKLALSYLRVEKRRTKP